MTPDLLFDYIVSGALGLAVAAAILAFVIANFFDE